MSARNPSPVPVFTHLGVNASNLVQITASKTDDDYDGWTIFRGDGSSEGPGDFVVPAGQALIVTDVFMDSRSTADNLSFSLYISKDGSGQMVYHIGSSSGESVFSPTFKDHMTAGFIVPAGWQLDEPTLSSTWGTFKPIIRLQGYFTSVQ